MVWLLSEHMNRDDLDKCWLCRSGSRSPGQAYWQNPCFSHALSSFVCVSCPGRLRAEPHKCAARISPRAGLATLQPIGSNRIISLVLAI